MISKTLSFRFLLHSKKVFLQRATLLSNLRCRNKVMDHKSDNQSHLLITAKQAREDVTTRAIVTDVRQESPTVRGISLRVENEEFCFKAGQWVDVFIPGVKEVGGFSISSSPYKLIETKKFDLAVKISKRAPAQWFYKQCQIGSIVNVRAGGDFHFKANSKDYCDNVLLIAGGVGINPLASILNYCSDMHRLNEIAPQKVLLLYSARDVDELLFQDEFLSICKEIPSIQCKFFVTRQSKKKKYNFPVEYSRIRNDHLQQAVATLGKDTLTTYICGPQAMINELKLILEEMGVPSDKVKFEKWW